VANLYLTEQGSVLRKTGDRLIVEKDGNELLEIECFKLDTVLVFGNVQITTPALTHLLQHDIELVLLTVGGHLKGQLTPPKAKNVLLRMAQYRLSQDCSFSLGLARQIVRCKLENSRALLARHHHNHPDRGFEIYRQELNRLAAKITGAQTMESLRGFEGSSARAYFEGFSLACRKELAFDGRRRRPPTDPINALLSLGYTLVGSELTSLLDGMGYDPYIGFYHQLDYGRPSLALDLLEEFRVPAVDRLVLNLTNLEALRKDDFINDEETGGLKLKRDPLVKFFRAYEEHLNRKFKNSVSGDNTTLRKSLQRQAERLASNLTQGEPYTPFTLEW